MLARCTSSLDLHMLIVPLWYLFRTLLVPKVALGYQYPNLSEGVDRVGGQLRGDKECPFSGVTKSGRVWRKVPKSGALCEPVWPSGKALGW